MKAIDGKMHRDEIFSHTYVPVLFVNTFNGKFAIPLDLPAKCAPDYVVF